MYPTTISSAVKMLKYQSIAPAPTSAQTEVADGKSHKFSARLATAPYNVDQTQSVQRRNARERNRVKQVNSSFAKLRQHIPQTIITDLTKGGGRGPQKKISKVDTLRIAVEYIRRLQDLVDDLNGSCDTSSSISEASSSSFCSNSSSQSLINDCQTASVPYQPLTKSPLPPFQHPSEFTGTTQFQPQQHQLQKVYSTILLTPGSLNDFSPTHQQLDTVCHSPSSSFNSSMSFDSGTFEPSAHQLSPHQPNSDHMELKFEPYENFNLNESDCTPDDEEILDYISLWQEQ